MKQSAGMDAVRATIRLNPYSEEYIARLTFAQFEILFYLLLKSRRKDLNNPEPVRWRLSEFLGEPATPSQSVTYTRRLTQLVKAGYVVRLSRGFYLLTDYGHTALLANRTMINQLNEWSDSEKVYIDAHLDCIDLRSRYEAIVKTVDTAERFRLTETVDELLDLLKMIKDALELAQQETVSMYEELQKNAN